MNPYQNVSVLQVHLIKVFVKRMLELQRIWFLLFLIIRFVSGEKGICGILKDSCDDFIVQEIDKNGQIVELKNQEVPEGNCILNVLCIRYE